MKVYNQIVEWKLMMLLERVFYKKKDRLLDCVVLWKLREIDVLQMEWKGYCIWLRVFWSVGIGRRKFRGSVEEIEVKCV